jgi:hypothetical protein
VHGTIIKMEAAGTLTPPIMIKRSNNSTHLSKVETKSIGLHSQVLREQAQLVLGRVRLKIQPLVKMVCTAFKYSTSRYRDRNREPTKRIRCTGEAPAWSRTQRQLKNGDIIEQNPDEHWHHRNKT